MALSPSSNFTNSLKRNNDIYPILSIAGGSTIYLSTRNVTVESQAYDGRLLNAPAITSSISLRKFEARTNNITLRIANDGYAPTFGQRTNQAVIIYLATDGTTSALSDCLKVFTGRVIGIAKLTPTEIAVECEDFAAWRYNKVLQNQVATLAGYHVPGAKRFRPLSYGNFNEDASSESSPGTCTSKVLRPVQLIAHDRDYLYYDEGINNTGGRPYIYAEGIDKFVPIEQAQTGSHSKFSTNTIRVDNDDDPPTNKSYFRHTVRLYPSTQAANADLAVALADSGLAIANAIDENDSTYQTCLAEGGGTAYKGVFGEYSGSLTGTIKTVKATIRGKSTGGSTVAVWIKAGDGTTILNQYVTEGNSWSYQLNNSSLLTSTKDITSVWASNAAGTNLNGIIYGFYQVAISATYVLYAYEMFIDFTTYIPLDENNAKSRQQEYPEKLYIGANGTALDDSGPYDADLSDHGPTEVHENILINLGPGAAKIDATSQAAVEASYDSGGLVRCTIDNPDMTVQDALLKLQKEAGFIAYVKPSDGKVYYLIEDGEQKSVDADLTTADYRNPVFGTIPLSDMIWSATANYDKHPAQNTYLSGLTTEDTTEKSNYNFGDNDGTVIMNNDWVNENEVAVNLVALFKFQRMTASCEILNPTLWKLEIGDTVTFSDPPADFRLRDSGADYTDFQFRIIETTRTVNSLKIKAMEVHNVND